MEDSSLIFTSKTKADDYHGEMNHDNFIKWFKEQFIPNLEELSIIIMDNASYHSKIEEENWLTEHNIDSSQCMFKRELLDLAAEHTIEEKHKMNMHWNAGADPDFELRVVME